MQWLSNLFMTSLDWIQVEVTSHCNAECEYCPHTVYAQSWRANHMPLETFKKLAPAFVRTRLVYLQGWGEPLLHPQFFDMLRIARECGCHVGTTTNGMLCDAKTAERMVAGGLSILGFSLAGTDESQDGIRRRAPLKNVLQAIKDVDETKKRLGISVPEVHVAYIWLRSQIEAIKELPALLEGTGVNQVVVSTLDFVPHSDLATEALHARDEAEEEFLHGMISEVVKVGKERGLDIFFRLVAPYREPGFCTENVTRSLFVSAQGLVSPCVFRNVPIYQKNESVHLDLYSPKHLTFGDVSDQSLTSIWRQKDYRAFRRNHAKRKGTKSCGNCSKLFCSEQALD
jgi:MoaA/NifB/PqqE/SkfB family radical SAM enzyme